MVLIVIIDVHNYTLANGWRKDQRKIQSKGKTKNKNYMEKWKLLTVVWCGELKCRVGECYDDDELWYELWSASSLATERTKEKRYGNVVSIPTTTTMTNNAIPLEIITTHLSKDDCRTKGGGPQKTPPGASDDVQTK